MLQTVVSSHETDHFDRMATYLHHLLLDHHFAADIVHGYGNPIVLWKYVVDPILPTVLVYGHYDTQDADIHQWRKYDPFSLYIGKDRIYGRWVAHNKGQFLIHLLTIFDLIDDQNLWYNIVVLLDGNYETWSSKLEQFLKAYIDDIRSDCFLVSDASLVGSTPCVHMWYRWSINLTLRLTTAYTSVDSGLYGGIIPNALHEMNILLDKMFDTHHRVTIPYFYYDVEDIPFDIAVKNKKIAFDEKTFMQSTGVKTLFRDKSIDIHTQLWLKPTIQVTGMSWWYLWDIYKNEIPHTVEAALNFRLVKKQTTTKVLSAFDQWIQTTLPPYVEYEIILWDMYEPVKLSTTNTYIKKAATILEHLFGTPVVYMYSGWWLPLVEAMEKIVHACPVLVPLANEDCNSSGVNENFTIALIEKWFQFSYSFFART